VLKLIRQPFDLDVLRCPRGAGRMGLIATIDGPVVVQRILARVGLPGATTGPPSPSAGAAARAERQALLDLII
jgi:hypothetical protein